MSIQVSFVTVNWNGKDYLLKCLESIDSLVTLKDYEVIVIDNASTDGSVEAVRMAYPQVKVIANDTNRGFSAANNQGMEISRGRYLCFLNSDIELLEGCVEELYQFMETHPDAGIAGPYVTSPRWKIHRTCKRFPRLWIFLLQALAVDKLFPGKQFCTEEDLAKDPDKVTRTVECLIGCFWFVRRAALDQVGLLDERFFIYSEDMDWCRRFWKANWKIYHHSKAHAIHIGSASSENDPVRFSVERIRSDLKYWEKYGGSRKRVLRGLIALLFYCIRLPFLCFAQLIRPQQRDQYKTKINCSLQSGKWILLNLFSPIK